MARFCDRCGASLSNSSAFCPACGNALRPPAEASGLSAAAAQPARTQEKTFFNAGGITVTTARFVVPGQTYAMSGVTSVQSIVRHPSRKGPFWMIVIGLFCLLAAIFVNNQPNNQEGRVGAGVLGAFLLVIGIIWWNSKRPVYAVRLTSASGETEACSSTDESHVDAIVNALNEAIVHRG